MGLRFFGMSLYYRKRFDLKADPIDPIMRLIVLSFSTNPIGYLSGSELIISHPFAGRSGWRADTIAMASAATGGSPGPDLIRENLAKMVKDWDDRFRGIVIRNSSVLINLFR